MKWPKQLGLILGLVWAGLVWLASNKPEDVQAAAQGWLSLPILRSVPDALWTFASSRVVIAITASIAGLAIARWMSSRPRKKQGHPWALSLANRFSLLANAIENHRWHHSLDRITAEIQVAAVEAAEHDLAFPKVEDGYTTIKQYVPYLRHVGALLRAQKIDVARHTARQHSARLLASV